MPANLGYISAMLFNQNNCAAEASTVTTKFEVEVGNDLCVMMGYDKDQCMGHLTAGGSVANIEAIWAARNVKYFPLGLQEALMKEDKLAKARGYKVGYIWYFFSRTILLAKTMYKHRKQIIYRRSLGRNDRLNVPLNYGTYPYINTSYAF